MYSLALAISPCCFAFKANALSLSIDGSEFVEGGDCGAKKTNFTIYIYR